MDIPVTEPTVEEITAMGWLVQVLVLPSASDLLVPLNLGSERLQDLVGVAQELSQPTVRGIWEAIRAAARGHRDHRLQDCLAFLRAYFPPDRAAGVIFAWAEVFSSLSALAGLDEFTVHRLQTMTAQMPSVALEVNAAALDYDAQFLADEPSESPLSYSLLSTIVNWSYLRQLWSQLEAEFHPWQLEALQRAAQAAFPQQKQFLHAPSR